MDNCFVAADDNNAELDPVGHTTLKFLFKDVVKPAGSRLTGSVRTMLIAGDLVSGLMQVAGG